MLNAITLVGYPKDVWSKNKMPIPKPIKNEDREIYLKRVLPMLTKEFPDNKQAVAVAMSTFRRHGKKKSPKKRRRLRLRKSFAEQQAKAILAGVSIIAGQGNQGSLYFDKKSNTARVVFRGDRNLDMAETWMNQVSEVLGIAKSRISTSPNAPKDWGNGSGWVCVHPDGSVETDPGLAAAIEDGPEAEDEPVVAETPPTAADGTPSASQDVIQSTGQERKAARLEMAYDERILKADEHPDYTLVVGVVMVPERFDNQGDIASAAVIEDAAHWFMEEQGKPAVMHKAALKKREATVVESYVVRGSGYSIGGTEVPEGAWVIAWRVYDPQTRAAIKKGIFGGFSLGADADYVNIAG